MEAHELTEGESVMELFINLVIRTPDSIANSQPEGEEFETTEHENIGNQVKLQFSRPSSGGTKKIVSGADALLRLPNGLKLSFGQIIALAGDFYGVPDKPIIDPTEKGDETSLRRKRFKEAYATLANADYNGIKEELDQIVKVMTKERRLIEEALEHKEENVAVAAADGTIRIVPMQVYEKHGTSLIKKWDEITGGKWIVRVPIVFGRVMKLAMNNYDHFLPFAKEAYLVGHELALEKAKDASKTENDEVQLRLLEEAYSIDAFACHFLTDSFSSGHLRTPRLELAKQVKPSKTGHLLTKYMHDEDNTYGLRVTNKRGDKWIAYGDGMLLSDEGEDNYKIAVEAVQASVDEVYEAFKFPDKATSPSRVTDYIPFVDSNEKNNFPMFQMKEGILLRRGDLENLSDSTTIRQWVGLGTVMKLRKYKPRQPAIGDDDDDDDDDTDELMVCRGCGQSLHPRLMSENTA